VLWWWVINLGQSIPVDQSKYGMVWYGMEGQDGKKCRTEQVQNYCAVQQQGQAGHVGHEAENNSNQFWSVRSARQLSSSPPSTCARTSLRAPACLSHQLLGVHVEEEGWQHAHGLLTRDVAALHQPGQPLVELRLGERRLTHDTANNTKNENGKYPRETASPARTNARPPRGRKKRAATRNAPPPTTTATRTTTINDQPRQPLHGCSQPRQRRLPRKAKSKIKTANDEDDGTTSRESFDQTRAHTGEARRRASSLTRWGCFRINRRSHPRR